MNQFIKIMKLFLTTFFFSIVLIPAVFCQSTYLKQEQLDAEKMQHVVSLIFEAQKFDAALSLLDKIAKNVPDNYAEIFRKHRRFWGHNEYMEYAEKTGHSIAYIEDAYNKMFYCYAVIHIERGNWDAAEEYLRQGLKQLPNEPHLLNEMGMLFQSKNKSSLEKNDLEKSIKYFMQAIDSDLCLSEMEARGLRGIGFSLIELGDLDMAEEYFNASLLVEDSELAHNELKYIKQLREKEKKYHAFLPNTTNNAEKITSYAFFQEQMNKLPEELQIVVGENKYAYIFSKAASLITKGAGKYREDDYFHYPLKEWNEEKIISGCRQIVYECRGLSPEYCFNYLSEDEFKNLLQLFHFDTVSIEKVNEKIIKGSFVHKMDKNTCTMYCNINAFETL
jgi:tetratricopeptide (TPR) repeat protein